jgi:hypothetical protein
MRRQPTVDKSITVVTDKEQDRRRRRTEKKNGGQENDKRLSLKKHFLSPVDQEFSK